MMKPEVVYHGRQLRSSVMWLALALFLGGSPLAVYFTMPDAKPSTLILAFVLGLPLFLLSLHDLGKSTGLVLNHETRQVKHVEGFFAWRRIELRSFNEVREVHLLQEGPDNKGTAEACWHLHLGFSGKGEIVLEEWSYEEAARRARYLGTTFGIQPRLNGGPLRVAMEAMPRPGNMPVRRVITYVVFYALGALMLVLSALSAWVRYMKA